MVKGKCIVSNVLSMNRRRFAGLVAAPALSGLLVPWRAGAQGTPGASPIASPGATPAAIPSSPVGQQLSWVLSMINDKHGEVSTADITAHVSPTVLSQASASQLQTVFKQLASQLGRVTVTGFATPPTPTRAVALIDSKAGVKLQIVIAVTDSQPYLITDLLFQPAGQKAATPTAVSSWDEVDRLLMGTAPQVHLLVAEVVKGKLQPIHGLNEAKPMPLGSAFKLYVLGELAHQIDEGKAHWDDELAIRDDWKSIPSGDMRNEPAGTKFTLQHYAEQMISVSDNTAADHLLFHLGRENVEGFQNEMGNSHASLNIPFLATREATALKVAMSADQAAMYLAAGREQRRQILNNQVAKTSVTLEEVAGWKEPRYIDKIEWFASSQDIGRALVTLQGMWGTQGLEPIKHILSINPGVHFDPKTWPYIGYKGGSEPGVLTVHWLLQRQDQRWFVVSVGFANPKSAFDDNAAVAAGASVVNFLAGVS